MERIADPASALPHMLPSEAQFAAAADALGVADDDALVSASPRCTHMLPCAVLHLQHVCVSGETGHLLTQPQVVYDNAGIFSAARAWWTWHVFGHRRWVLPFCARGLPVIPTGLAGPAHGVAFCCSSTLPAALPQPSFPLLVAGPLQRGCVGRRAASLEGGRL